MENILRCLILKQQLKISYEQLSFHLSDSMSYRSFTRLAAHINPSKSTLQSTIRRIKPQTLENVHNVLSQHFFKQGESKGKQRWILSVEHYRGLTLKIVDQTTRRVILKEKVPSSEKTVSLFEPHTDIIVKGARDIQYGHKLNLT
ncbi:hypothetical protein MNBD_GAMMA11-299 [hydrothermal vent metagenome]|uniref:Uncharacterized protein n=1 Tax=hydrothermal vent metagenome TaxID=652676 RepID=A0A3B0XY18_9ZZZZ